MEDGNGDFEKIFFLLFILPIMLALQKIAHLTVCHHTWVSTDIAAAVADTYLEH